MIFTKEVYKQRRKKLRNFIGNGLLIINGNDLSPMNCLHNVYPFVQDSTFLYYFGIEKEGLIGIIDSDNDIDYIIGQNQSIDNIIWEGTIPSLKDYSAKIGTDKILEINQLEDFLKKNIDRVKKIPQ